MRKRKIGQTHKSHSDSSVDISICISRKFKTIVLQYICTFYIVRARNVEVYHRQLTCRRVCKSKNFLVKILKVTSEDLQNMCKCKPCKCCCFPSDKIYKRTTKQTNRRILPYYKSPTNIVPENKKPSVKLLKMFMQWNSDKVLTYIMLRIHEVSLKMSEGHLINQLAKGCGGLSIFGLRRNLSIWYFFQQTVNWKILKRNTNFQLLSTCKVKDCFSHHLPVRYNLDLETLNEYEYEYLCKQFNKLCEVSKQLSFHGSPCILWKGTYDVNGYGRMSCLYRRNHGAHIVAWELSRLCSVPSHLQIRHLCNRPACVNEDHLEIGTAKENYQDKVKAGTHAHGNTHYKAKLPEEVARQVIKSIGNGKTTRERAKQFGLTVGHINAFDCGECWKHLLDDTDVRNRRMRKKNSIITKTLETAVRNELQSNKKLSRIALAKKYHINRKTVARIANTQPKTENEIKAEYYQHLKELIESKRQVQEGHWLIPPSCKAGYSSMAFYNSTRQSHIVSWIVYNNETDLPNGKLVRHKCRYRNCVNPEHLEIGTYKDNGHDKIRDGTSGRGEKNPRCSTPEFIVRQIIATKQHPLFQNVSRGRVARFFAVSKSQISHIDHNESWTHIPRRGLKLHLSIAVHIYLFGFSVLWRRSNDREFKA
jgi:hypothetical protein